MKNKRKSNRILKPSLSGLDHFLKESFREDRAFKALFEKEAEKLSAAKARRKYPEKT